jgi:hypothetical protein
MCPPMLNVGSGRKFNILPMLNAGPEPAFNMRILAINRWDGSTAVLRDSEVHKFCQTYVFFASYGLQPDR